MSIEPSVDVATREDLALLLNGRQLHAGVEVGVDQADFACRFLQRWTGYQLWAVDNWKPYGEMDRPRDSDRFMALARLSAFVPRVRVIEMDSVAAAVHLGNCHVPIQFVYIDAGHRKQDVQQDLAAWYPILQDHGMIAGHDFDKDGHPGVVEAVTEFANAFNLDVRITKDAHTTPSWYAFKPASK